MQRRQQLSAQTTTAAQPAGHETPVILGGVRGGPSKKTLRTDRWWLQPAATASGLLVFVVYATWAAFQNANYYVGPAMHRDYLSPLYSPCLAQNCKYVWGPVLGSWWSISPAIAVLIFPLGLRLTCYYYRKAYYRSYWGSPPACAVADAHRSYTGETRFPLVLQNAHRWFFYIGAIFAGINIFDAVAAFRGFSGGIGMGLGTLILCVNGVLLSLYTLSCHSCRHLLGGQLRSFHTHRFRYWLWDKITPLNKHHMLFAWLSLFWVAFTDLYIRLVAAGWIHDPRFF